MFPMFLTVPVVVASLLFVGFSTVIAGVLSVVSDPVVSVALLLLQL